ncbi:MAG: hypothetical protein AAF192_15655 [Pseudomonadota bacterium]
MTRMELTLVFALAMAGAVVCGWGLRALWRRVAGEEDDALELADLSTRLAVAEEARDALQAEAAQAIAALEHELGETRGSLQAALAERQAELDATMEIVRVLRQEIADLRARGDAA